MGRSVTPYKEQRRQQAEARVVEWQKLSPSQQWDELDRRLGPGKGAKKQREKIYAKLKEARNA